MTLGDICNRDTIVIGQDESIVAAARLMRTHHVGSVVVVEATAGGNRPIGILTDRDLVVEILAAELDPAAVAVGDVMSFHLATGTADESLWDGLQRMRAVGVRRMPVVDADGFLVGIVSTDDLLELLVEEFGQLVKIIGREQVRERQARTALA